MTTKYTLTIHGQITIETENYDEIKLDNYKISELNNLKIENVEKCTGQE